MLSLKRVRNFFIFFSFKQVSDQCFFPTFFMFRNHHKTAQFTIFEDWVSFGNYMTVFYHNLLYKGIDGELKLIPG